MTEALSDAHCLWSPRCTHSKVLCHLRVIDGLFNASGAEPVQLVPLQLLDAGRIQLDTIGVEPLKAVVTLDHHGLHGLAHLIITAHAGKVHSHLPRLDRCAVYTGITIVRLDGDGGHAEIPPNVVHKTCSRTCKLGIATT